MHLKCFCWAAKHMQTINFSPCTHTKGSNIFNSTNTPPKFSLCSFSFAFLFLCIRSSSVGNKFCFLLINCFLLNLTQQLKFFRRRFEIVVLVLCNLSRIFVWSAIKFRRRKGRGWKSLMTRIKICEKNWVKTDCGNELKAINLKSNLREK